MQHPTGYSAASAVAIPRCPGLLHAPGSTEGQNSQGGTRRRSPGELVGLGYLGPLGCDAAWHVQRTVCFRVLVASHCDCRMVSTSHEQRASRHPRRSFLKHMRSACDPAFSSTRGLWSAPVGLLPAPGILPTREPTGGRWSQADKAEKHNLMKSSVTLCSSSIITIIMIIPRRLCQPRRRAQHTDESSSVSSVSPKHTALRKSHFWITPR